MDIMKINKFLDSLEERMKKFLPGPEAQEKMIPTPRLGHRAAAEVEGSCIKAGVLILLYPWKGQIHLVLTRRTEQVSRHQAQISFPGGQCDPGESVVQTALREAQEELDILPDGVRILGELTPLYIPPTRYCIYPVVGAAAERPDFHPSAREVAEIIEIPVGHLMDNDNIRNENRIIRGQRIQIPFFHYRGNKVWGATAMVLCELLELVTKDAEQQIP